MLFDLDIHDDGTLRAKIDMHICNPSLIWLEGPIRVDGVPYRMFVDANEGFGQTYTLIADVPLRQPYREIAEIQLHRHGYTLERWEAVLLANRRALIEVGNITPIGDPFILGAKTLEPAPRQPESAMPAHDDLGCSSLARAMLRNE